MRAAFVLSVTILCSGAFSAPQTPKSLRAKIQAKYDAWSEGTRTNNQAPWSKILAPNYIQIGLGGEKLDRTTVLRNGSNLGMVTNTKGHRSIKLFRTSGNLSVAVVESNFSMDCDVEGRKMPSTIDTISIDQWNKVNAIWLMTGSHTLKMALDIDGQKKVLYAKDYKSYISSNQNP